MALKKLIITLILLFSISYTFAATIQTYNYNINGCLEVERYNTGIKEPLTFDKPNFGTQLLIEKNPCNTRTEYIENRNLFKNSRKLVETGSKYTTCSLVNREFVCKSDTFSKPELNPTIEKNVKIYRDFNNQLIQNRCCSWIK